MAAKMLKNTFCVLSSLLSRSAANQAALSAQRVGYSYVLSRRCSLLCHLQRNRDVFVGQFRTTSTTRARFSLVRSLASNTSSPLSQLTESENQSNDENTQDKLKKLTLDDIISQWPDNKPVWLGYRRNHKGQIPRKTTRLRCTTVSKKLLSQNPCPICRVRVEENYEIESKDVVFLSQFISPHTGEVLDTMKTGVCRQQQKKLIQAIEKARDQGYLPFTIPGPRDPARPFKAAGIPAPNLRNKTG